MTCGSIGSKAVLKMLPLTVYSVFCSVSHPHPTDQSSGICKVIETQSFHLPNKSRHCRQHLNCSERVEELHQVQRQASLRRDLCFYQRLQRSASESHPTVQGCFPKPTTVASSSLPAEFNRTYVSSWPTMLSRNAPRPMELQTDPSRRSESEGHVTASPLQSVRTLSAGNKTSWN